MANASDRLDHVTVADEEAFSCLVAHSLPVLRVEKSLPHGSLCVIWRNCPSPEQQLRANRLIRGQVPTHSW
jgi:hypothetical protein